MDGNPWQVDSLQDFLYLKCPECTFDTQEDLSFQNHALENHPLSFVFFGQTFVKEENFEINERYIEDYKDPLITNGEAQDHSNITSSEILSSLPIIPKLSNIKEDLIDIKSEFREAVTEEANYSDLIKKYKHIEEFFIFESSETKENGIIGMEFSCVNCLPLRKVLKTTSQGPVSNLKGHLIKRHPDLIDRFKALLGCKQRKSRKKIGTVNIEDPHNFEFEDLAIKYKYIEDFFSLQSTKLKENGAVSMEFSCVNCLPAKIVVWTRKRVPVWGLKNHMMRKHPDLADSFKALLESYTQTKKEFKKHEKEVQNAEKIQCPKCDKKMAPESLNGHIKRIHDRIFPFVCNTCGYKATCNSELKKHTDMVHEGKKHICPICGVGFHSPTYLKTHITSVHEGKKPYKCELCDTCCSQKSGLRLHMKKVHNAEKIQCPKCDKMISSYNLLTHTKRVHDKIFPFLCNTCGFKATSNGVLKRHVDTEHEGKRHICQICGLGLKSPYNLKDHIASVHEGKKPYKCELCDNSYDAQWKLNSHIRIVHEKIKLHKCNECQKSFGEKAQLKKHITIAHVGIKAFKCSLCDKTFFFKRGLNDHYMKIHEGIKKEKSHMCSQCGASFSEAHQVRRHSREVHEKITPYVCKICNHGFKQKGNLKHHLATVHKGIENI